MEEAEMSGATMLKDSSVGDWLFKKKKQSQTWIPHLRSKKKLLQMAWGQTDLVFSPILYLKHSVTLGKLVKLSKLYFPIVS